MKLIVSIAFFVACLLPTIAMQNATAQDTITGNIVKKSEMTFVSFEENVPVAITQSDIPVAVQFEKVDGHWSMTLYEVEVKRFDQIKTSAAADAVIVGKDGVLLLRYIQTYDPCPQPKTSWLVFSPYNFTMQMNCPYATSQSAQ